MGSRWPPSHYLPDYQGQYPRQDLEQARQTLINCLQYNHSEVIERLKPRLGLSSRYGSPITPPPLPQQDQQRNNPVPAPSSKRGIEDGSELSKKRSKPDEGEQKVYKCDFCSFTCLLSAQMSDHLTAAQHFSGSIYTAKRREDCSAGYTLLSIHKMLAVKNKFSKAKALIVVCPECKDIFEDIFMCGMHYKYKHGTANGFYSICPVIHHETVTVPVQPVCQSCDKEFSRQRQLHTHWAQFPEHHPVVKPARDNVFVLCICPYCQKTFYDNFLSCKGHVIEHHRSDGAVTRGLMAVEIKHVLLPMRKEELPLFNTSGTSDGIKDELMILHNMKRHFQKMSGQKQKLAEIIRRIKHLQTLHS